MEVVVGRLAGFCGGVINSIKETDNILDEYEKVYCLGELVHNKQAVDKLKSKGLVVIDSLDEVEDGANVIIRAHGVSLDVYDEAKRRNINLFDLTCPNVLRIHKEAIRLVDEEYLIILIAHENHPEAIGTISFCGEDGIVLEDEDKLEDVINLISKSNKKRIAIISQTTYSVTKFNNLVNLIKERLNGYEIFVNNTICSATDLRQKETMEMSLKVNAMIIIGGKNSSNTKKLYEIALSKCDNTFIIEVLDDLTEDMSKYSIVGVMAGASTPRESIDEVVNYLKEI